MTVDDSGRRKTNRRRDYYPQTCHRAVRVWPWNDEDVACRCVQCAVCSVHSSVQCALHCATVAKMWMERTRVNMALNLLLSRPRAKRAQRAKRRAVLIFYTNCTGRPTHTHTPASHRGQKKLTFWHKCYTSTGSAYNSAEWPTTPKLGTVLKSLAKTGQLLLNTRFVPPFSLPTNGPLKWSIFPFFD
jgi:hypothetical protein